MRCALHQEANPAQSFVIRLNMLARTLQTLFYIAYPAVVYFGYQYLPTRQLGLLLLALYGATVLLNLRGSIQQLGAIIRQHVPLVGLILGATAFDNSTLLLFLPMVVSGYLLSTFALTLRSGPPMIERFARAIEGDLPPFTLDYCRRVTIAWCVFMTLNTAAIGVLILAAPIEIWALYTGGVFYVLLGLLIGLEVCYRKWLFRFYGDGLGDRLFSRLFPAEATAFGRRSLEYDRARKLSEAESTAGPLGA
jgi:uncharacterized membrane protein